MNCISEFIWKPASALKSDPAFQMQKTLEIGVWFQCRRRFPNVLLSGNWRRVIMWTLVFDYIFV